MPAARVPAARMAYSSGVALEGAPGSAGRTESTSAFCRCGSWRSPGGRLLLNRGADIESRDTSWDSTPLDWAKVGSGQGPGDNPSPDWILTVRTLLEAGASIAEVTLSPDDLKPASSEVTELLRSYRARDEDPGSSP